MRIWFELEEENEDEEDIYKEEGIDQKLNEDCLKDYEAAFMRGYLGLN